jgi:hypothetical protein
MTAIVSSISCLLRGVTARRAILTGLFSPFSNVYATAEPGRVISRPSPLMLWFLVVAPVLAPNPVEARQQAATQSVNRAASVGGFVGGAVVGLVAHEAGHLFFDVIFDADPTFKRVEFHGIPFFAISPRARLSPREEFAISSAGFWVQEATNEWLLTRRPRLRSERAPFTKGIFTFNIVASFAYSGAAFSRSGPVERDTRGMASSIGVDERWIGALVLAPAVFDTWRYFDPDAKLPVWLSRAVKVFGVLLILK